MTNVQNNRELALSLHRFVKKGSIYETYNAYGPLQMSSCVLICFSSFVRVMFYLILTADRFSSPTCCVE